MVAKSSFVPGRKRVLVVDDHFLFREGIVAWIMRQSGLEYCGWADSFASATNAIESTNPDLVLLDLQLREGDGFDVLRMLKESARTLRVLVVSQKDELLFAERALHAGAHGYVPKYEASETMPAATEMVLGGGIYICSSLRRPSLGPVGAEGISPPKHTS